MLTCAQLGEAVGMAACHAVRSRRDPKSLAQGESIRAIQRDLFLADHHIHAFDLPIAGNIAPEASVIASSVYSEGHKAESWGTDRLRSERMLQLPVTSAKLDSISLLVDADRDTELRHCFHQGPENGSTYPEAKLTEGSIKISAGEQQWIELPIACAISRPGWHFLILGTNPDLAVHMTETPPGKRWYYPRPADAIRPNPFSTWTARTLRIGMTRAVDADGASVVSPDWNGHARNFAAEGMFHNFAYLCRTSPEQAVYDAALVVNGHSRPTRTPNLWVSAASSFSKPEWIELSWETPRTISEVQLLFDSALHFHFWQSWQGYPVRSLPSIVRDYRLIAHRADGTLSTIVEVTGNFQRNRRHRVALEGITRLRLEILGTNGLARAQVYEIRVLGAAYGAPRVR
jgi:hypothetical protein